MYAESLFIALVKEAFAEVRFWEKFSHKRTSYSQPNRYTLVERVSVVHGMGIALNLL